MNGTLPKDTYLTCNWENGITHPLMNESFSLSTPSLVQPPNQIFNVVHNFSASGEFLLRCNMSNFVSWQQLDFNVR